MLGVGLGGRIQVQHGVGPGRVQAQRGVRRGGVQS